MPGPLHATMSSVLKKTLSHSAIYGIGTVLSKATSVVMLPIYTRFLSPADYGLLELLSMLTDLTALVFGMRIFMGVYRYYFETEDPKKQGSVIATALIANVALHGLGVLFLISVSSPASEFVLKDLAHRNLVIAFAFSLLTMSLITVPMLYIRAQQRPWLYVAVSATKLVIQVSLNAWFIVVLQWGPAGIVASTLITGGIVGLGLLVWALKRTGLSFSLDVLRRLASFGWPLMLANLFAFYITFGDRLFIQHYWNLTELGLYALAYQFGFALYSLGVGTFMQIWSTESYLVYRRPSPETVFQRVFLAMMLSLIMTGTCISIFSFEILTLMADPAFLAAYTMIPLLVTADVIKAGSEFTGFSIAISEKTSHFLEAAAISSGVITIAYFLLIPPFGGVGAGIATVAGMLAELWWTVRTGRRYFDMKLPWLRVLGAFSAGATAYGAAMLLQGSFLIVVLMKCVIVVILLVGVFYSPVLSTADRALVVDMLRRLRPDSRPAP